MMTGTARLTAHGGQPHDQVCKSRGRILRFAPAVGIAATPGGVRRHGQKRLDPVGVWTHIAPSRALPDWAFGDGQPTQRGAQKNYSSLALWPASNVLAGSGASQ